MTWLEKLFKAQLMLLACIGRLGIWASLGRYAYQCWTRDFGLALMQALLLLGKQKQVRRHLESLSKRQRPNGQIPILFLDGWWGHVHFFVQKTWRSLHQNKWSFMLDKYLKGELWSLTPGTRDSELLYIIAMYEYAQETGDRSLLQKYASNIRAALAYLEKHLMEGGLLLGCDWRDTREKELGRKALLTNNCLLVHLYDLMGEQDKAAALRQRINKIFWSGNILQDWPGNTRPDPLGLSLAVIYDVVSPDRYPDIIACFQMVDTACGFTIQCKHNAVTPEEGKMINRTDGIVVWPFASLHSVPAFIKMERLDLGLAQFRKVLALQGYWEYYDPTYGDPSTAKGYGAAIQGWTVAWLIRAQAAILGAE